MLNVRRQSHDFKNLVRQAYCVNVTAVEPSEISVVSQSGNHIGNPAIAFPINPIKQAWLLDVIEPIVAANGIASLASGNQSASLPINRTGASFDSLQ